MIWKLTGFRSSWYGEFSLDASEWLITPVVEMQDEIEQLYQSSAVLHAL